MVPFCTSLSGPVQFFPDPNLARQKQIFEVWIRPVVPENAHEALRIALFEVDKLVKNGLSKEEFEATRDYLMKTVFVITATSTSRSAKRSTQTGTGSASTRSTCATAWRNSPSMT